MSEYQEYLAERAKWKLIYTRAQQVAGIDNEVIDDFDARVYAVVKDGRITVWYWKMYTDLIPNDSMELSGDVYGEVSFG